MNIIQYDHTERADGALIQVLTVHPSLAWVTSGRSGEEEILQTNPDFMRFVFVLVWVKQFCNNFRRIITLSKWGNVLMLLEARIFTKEERTQKYGMGQGKKEPCGDELDLKTLVWTHDFKICLCVCTCICKYAYKCVLCVFIRVLTCIYFLALFLGRV